MKQSVRALILRGQDILLMERHKGSKHYFTLVGGAVEASEKPEEALFRELDEETGIIISDPKLVVIEDAGDTYGEQLVFLCTYVSGEPTLSPSSEENKLNTIGFNRYKPLWVPLSKLNDLTFRSENLKQIILKSIQSGWPAEIQKIKS